MFRAFNILTNGAKLTHLESFAALFGVNYDEYVSHFVSRFDYKFISCLPFYAARVSRTNERKTAASS